MTDTNKKQTIIMTDQEAFPSSCPELGECYEGHGYLDGDEDESVSVYWEITNPESENMDEHVDNWDRPLFVYGSSFSGRHISEFDLILAHEKGKISAYVERAALLASIESDEPETDLSGKMSTYLEQKPNETPQDKDISNTTSITYYAIGDMLNGDTERFEDFYQAKNAYEKMINDGIECETRNQTETELSDEEIQEMASDHFYFQKVTDFYDENGHPDDQERVDVSYGYTPVETILVQEEIAAQPRVLSPKEHEHAELVSMVDDSNLKEILSDPAKKFADRAELAKAKYVERDNSLALGL